LKNSLKEDKGRFPPLTQNKYDDPAFYANYSKMRRSIGGLEEAGEWDSFRSLMPSLKDKRVLDLGCGFSWHCKYAIEQGASKVVGLDVSKKMLSRAKEITDGMDITFLRTPIEDISFGKEQFDVVISSLALHYVSNIASVCKKVYEHLSPKGSFVFSVEHPIFTSLAAQEWCTDSNGNRLHWPLDRYQAEGVRHTIHAGRGRSQIPSNLRKLHQFSN
jgi:2-polyprenyl-3-methyl-5-hydroxy-6-metoxy-1,4-benzoquinol methylase